MNVCGRLSFRGTDLYWLAGLWRWLRTRGAARLPTGSTSPCASVGAAAPFLVRHQPPTQGLAQMLAEDGIRVDAVASGPVWTPLIPATMLDPAEFGKQSPLGRPAQPAEPAPADVFLASEVARFVTGEIMTVTGGVPLP